MKRSQPDLSERSDDTVLKRKSWPGTRSSIITNPLPSGNGYSPKTIVSPEITAATSTERSFPGSLRTIMALPPSDMHAPLPEVPQLASPTVPPRYITTSSSERSSLEPQ